MKPMRQLSRPNDIDVNKYTKNVKSKAIQRKDINAWLMYNVK